MSVARRHLCIGLMSGTSLDGVDGVVAAFSAEDGRLLEVLAHVARPFEAGLRTEMLALNTASSDELHRAALAANALALQYAHVVQGLLADTRLAPQAIEAIGAHGQTVRHRPGEFDGTGYTVQLLNGALLAECSGIPVVCDLRSRDVAAGGQGAPLVPAFHQAVFGRPGRALAVLNLGGIANLTLLPADGAPALGFDCGPGNVLMDLWCERHLGARYDDGGRWAAAGRPAEALLCDLLAEPWLGLPPPKSTGRDLFHEAWLAQRLARHPGLAAADVQATLCAFTAQACADHLRRHAPATRTLLVCGGGALNATLMQALSQRLPGVAVDDSGLHGLPPLQVEATAFAWLARQRLAQAPGNLPSVTGARGPRVLGAIHAA